MTSGGPQFIKFLENVGDAFVVSSALARLSMSRFVQKIFAIKSRNRRKSEQMQKLCGPNFLWEGRLRLLYGSLLGRITTHYLAKFG